MSYIKTDIIPTTCLYGAQGLLKCNNTKNVSQESKKSWNTSGITVGANEYEESGNEKHAWFANEKFSQPAYINSVIKQEAWKERSDNGFKVVENIKPVKQETWTNSSFNGFPNGASEYQEIGKEQHALIGTSKQRIANEQTPWFQY